MPPDSAQPAPRLADAAARRAVAVFRRHPELLPFLAMAALLAWNAVFTPNFAHFEVRDGRLYGSMVDILQNGAPVMLLAIGMTLVIALAGIDLSVGSVMALAGTVAALLLESAGCSGPVAVAGALAVAALVGAFNGVMVTFVGLQPIIATLVLLVAGRGIALTLTGDQKIQLTSSAFEWLRTGGWLALPSPIYVSLGVAVVVLVVLRKTALGLYIEAIGGNARAARLAGLPVHTVRLVAYTFSGLCAGLAGVLATAKINEADVANCGLYLELDAILAVVIGGTSLTGGRARLLGALCGAVIMQTLTVMLQMHNVKTEHTLIVKALVALAVCLIQTPAFAEFLRRAARRPVRAA